MSDRRALASFWKTDAVQKVIVALAVPFILAVAAYASGMIELPARVKQQESRLVNVEADVRTMRESNIRRDEQFGYITKQLDRLIAQNERRR